MRKLILEEWISLDGYAVDKIGQLDFFPPPKQTATRTRISHHRRGRLLFPEHNRYTKFRLKEVRKYDTGLVCLQHEP